MITLWHNPRCSKSRQALALLEERGAQVNVYRYLADMPSRHDIEQVASKLGLPPSHVTGNLTGMIIEFQSPSGSRRDTKLPKKTENPSRHSPVSPLDEL